MYSRTTDDYENMSKAGIEVVVQPSFWLGSPRTSVGTFVDYWEHMISFETQRAKRFGIEHFVCISVNPKEARTRPLALDAIIPMEKYLDRERVVAVGEIGFDLITQEEEELFIKQIQIAKSRDMLMLIHLPHKNKPDGIQRTAEIIETNSFKRSKIIIDHNTEETIKQALKLDVYAGLTIYPNKISPERAISIMQQHGTDRTLLNSAADWDISDPLSVPTTAVEMRKAGFPASEIEKVTFYNPYEFYRQSPKFTWRS